MLRIWNFAASLAIAERSPAPGGSPFSEKSLKWEVSHGCPLDADFAAMHVSDIVIKGAREHNLQDVSLVLPRNKLICLTGVSGSGKSSLAFDTLYAEGQRRYVESLSSFARQFLGQMPKPDVDYIVGLSPSISISQKSAGKNPRSTVGTITEIYDYLRVLFARVGDGHCPECKRPIEAQSREQILERILQLESGTKFVVLAPRIQGQKGEYRDLFEELLRQGFVRARVDGEIVSLSDDLQLDRQMRHNIEVVIDRLTVKKGIRPRLAEAVELALKIGKGELIVGIDQPDEKKAPKKKAKRGRAKQTGGQPGDILFSTQYACTDCGLSFASPSPQMFSFNSPQGMCPECDGMGELYTFDPELLVPDPSVTFKKGCFEIIGTWKDLGRWKRHIYQGVADTIERLRELPAGTMLETPWGEIDPAIQDLWLWGTGEQHITFTWRGGSSPQKYGGEWEGIIPDLLTKYTNSKSKPQIRKLEGYMDTVDCPLCHGDRLNPQAGSVTITSKSPAFAKEPSKSLPEVCHLAISEAVEFFGEVELDNTRMMIASEALKEIRGRLGFLTNVGLEYLALNRTAPTLSGGESQRIRLAGQIGCGLVGVLYILDEPSIGLHPRDNDRLLATISQLRDLGNTVVVVEHDEDTMRMADHIIDFGPGPGVRGGEVVAEGPLETVLSAKKSVTGKYLSGDLEITIPEERRPGADEKLQVIGARHNNLKNIDVDIPLGKFVCITGVSGSGKSSLINDILANAIRQKLYRGAEGPGKHDRIDGIEHLDKMISIDQSPIGRTPRSNPGTYIKVFDDIRTLFTQLPESKRRGYKPGRFSFNVKGGRCEACEGNGSTRLEMDFLADIWVTCPVCEGHRFNRETLQVTFKDKSISDILEMDVQQAVEFFENVPKVRTKLQTLHDVGLDYLKIGQPSPTLSGGEAQRVKLARELVKKSTGSTLYLLDEPTTGLHFADIDMLLKVLHGFVDVGNTVLVVEHNLDVVKTADWIIDIGPEGGAAGGELVVAGTPEEVAACKKSHTGKALAAVLEGKTSTESTGAKLRKRSAAKLATHIEVRGAEQHNLKCVDAKIARDEMTVLCGPSGSGKSSLAMDTIYAEGQRRYVESLSAYARQFVGQMQKPKLDHIEGLSPAITIEQKNMGHTPRSTVGTVTEIYDYMRILMARLGTPHCPDCDVEVGTQTADQVVDKVLALPQGTRFYLMAPVELEVGRAYSSLWEELQTSGYVRVRVDGTTYPLEEAPHIDRRRKHEVEIVVDRIVVKTKERTRIAESIEHALALGKGVMNVAHVQTDVVETKWLIDSHNQHLACDQCGRSFERLTPHNFSFNSSLGWCTGCEGLGTQTGANPAALIRDNTLSLAEGALAIWPHVSLPVSQAMLAALSHGTGVPIDVPLDSLSPRQRRVVMHGTGEEWFDVLPPGKPKKNTKPIFRFQFKGLYPALEDASKVSPSFRTQLEHLIGEVECSTCTGSRLRDDASAMKLRGHTVGDLCQFPLGELQAIVNKWKFTAREKKIAGELVREIKNRTQFLVDVGLEYLALSRSAPTLSAGEAQRIRLASQLGSGLCGVLYVLDEPTIGLHPRDNTRLLSALHKLRDLGNTLIVVEHDREVIDGSDAVLDFGPAAGRGGGEIVAQGTPTQLAKRRGSVTGPYLSGKKAIPVPTNRRPARDGASGNGWLEVIGATHNNLRQVDARIPLGTLTALTGPSGSGKSSLLHDVLYASLARTLHRAGTIPGAHREIRGVEWINKVIRVDQRPLGNSPSSNPATYTGAFDHIRQLFSLLPTSKLRGYTARRFSFNVPGGRCDACDGNGQNCIEMHFLPDVWVDCETCMGHRYNEETLSVKYRGRSIAEVLEMSCGQAVELFENVPKISRILQTLCDVGLEYLTLGQSAPTLSGGEAQRVKLAAELSRPDTGRTMYLLDEPTTGLHFDDLAKLLDVLHRLVDLGNTVVVIEHNLDVIKSADWLIDMGPEAGVGGGQVVAAGPPEQIVEHAQKALAKGTPKKKKKAKKKAAKKSTKKAAAPLLRSHTGEALAEVLEAGPHVARPAYDFEAEHSTDRKGFEIEEIGENTKMPWEVDGLQWHTVDRVGRGGEACKWDGKMLAEIVDRIHKQGEFSETNWKARTVVEISAPKKSDGWFFHAITGEAWLLKLKFRVARSTFQRKELVESLNLGTLNDRDDIPMYSNESRVKCKNLRGPWQEVQVHVHSWDEVNRPEFWGMLEKAVGGFSNFTTRVASNPDDVMPWKKLGQKWHISRKGFPPGKRVQWETEVLEELCEMLSDTAPEGQFLWNNQQLVHMFVAQQKEPWATVHTKRTAALDLVLNGPKGKFALGRLAQLGCERELDTAPADRDVVKVRFRSLEDLSSGDLADFLSEHIEQLEEGAE